MMYEWDKHDDLGSTKVLETVKDMSGSDPLKHFCLFLCGLNIV